MHRARKLPTLFSRTTMFHIGIDPDTKDLAIAAWLDGHGPHALQVVHVVGANRTGEQSQVRMARLLAHTNVVRDLAVDNCEIGTIAIEGQQIDRRRARPADLFTLAHVSGMAALWCALEFGPGPRVVIPTPKEWKGSVAKHAMQGRLYKDLGWGSTVVGSGDGRYARPLRVPDEFQYITPGQWKHVGDAILLARWASENHHQA